MTQQRISEIVAKWKFDPTSTQQGQTEINKLTSAVQGLVGAGMSAGDALANPAIAAAMKLNAERVSEVTKMLMAQGDAARAATEELNKVETARQGLLRNLQGSSDAQAASGFMRELTAIQQQEADARQKNVDIQRMMNQELQTSVRLQTDSANLAAGAITSRLNAMRGQQLIAQTVEQAGSFVGGLRDDAFGAGPQTSPGQRIYKLGRDIFMLPNVNFPGAAGLSSTDLSRGLMVAGGAADRANLSWTKLAVTMGLVGSAAVGVIVLLSAVVNALNTAAEAEKARARLIAETAKEIAGDTTDELVARRAAAQMTLALEQENRERLLNDQRTLQLQLATTGLRDVQRLAGFSLNAPGTLAAESAIKGAIPGLGVPQNTLDVLGALRGNSEALQESEKSLEATTKKIDTFTDAIDENAAAANDAVARLNRIADIQRTRAELRGSSDVDAARDKIGDFQVEIGATWQQIIALSGEMQAAQAAGNETGYVTLYIEKLRLEAEHDLAVSNQQVYESMLPVIEANARLQAVQETAARIANANAEAQIAGDRMTEQERGVRVEEIAREIEIWRRVMNQPGLSQKELDAMDTRISNLRVESLVLDAINNSTGDVLAAQERLKEQNDELFESMDLLAEATAKLNELQTELIASQQEHEDKIAQIDDERESRRSEAVDKRDKDIDRLRRENARDLGRQLADIERNSNRRIAEIKEQGTRRLEDLIAKGDQAAAIQALGDMQFQIEQEKKKRGEAEDDRKRQAQDALDDQFERVEAAYQEQLEAADKAHQRSIAQENARWRKEEAQRREAITKAENDQRNAAAALNNIQQAMHSQGIFNEQYWANSRLSIVQTTGEKIYTAFKDMLTRMLGAVNGTSGGSVPPPSNPGAIPPSNPNPTGFIPLGAPAHPTRGQVYKDPFGDIWVYNGTSWQRGYTAGQATVGTAGNPFGAGAMTAQMIAPPRSFGDIPANVSGNHNLSGPSPRELAGGAGTIPGSVINEVAIYTSEMPAGKLARAIRAEFVDMKPTLVNEISAEMAQIRAKQQSQVTGRKVR